MFYDSATNTMHFKAYRVPIRCWRCWKRYEVFTPYEFVDVMRFQCDRCGKRRVIPSYSGYGEAESKFLDLRYPSLRREDESKRHMNEFLPVFENHWVSESCSCGGHFRFRAPFRCPHCRSRALVFWWFRGEDEVVESPPIPVLRFTIPPEYANSPARPPWQPET